MLPRTAALACLLLSQVAFARPFYVEGPAVRTRSEATSLAQLVQTAGYRPRIVRRYGHGEGWRFSVVLDGFDARQQASEVAHAVSSLTGRSHGVFATDVLLSPADARAAGSATTAAAVPSASALIARARTAHGGHGTLERVSSAEQLIFRFVRTMPDGRSVMHTYARRLKDRYLRIDVLEGKGTSSEFRVTGSTAWLRVGEQGWRPQDAPRTREVVEQFAPDRVLEAALGLPDALTNQRELALLELGDVTADLAELRYDGAGRVAAVWIRPSDGRVTRWMVGTGGDQVSRELHGLAGSVLAPVPERMITRRGSQVLDDVKVMLLQSGGTVPDAWFDDTGT